MQSIVFILCYSIANLLPAKDAGTPTPPTEPPTCIRFVPTADYMKMDYDDVKNLKIIRDSIGTHGTGTGAFLVGLFVKVPCKR